MLHSDLKVRNVLLTSDASGRGCVAKVADFGLAVKLDCMDTHISAFQVCWANFGSCCLVVMLQTCKEGCATPQAAPLCNGFACAPQHTSMFRLHPWQGAQRRRGCK